MNDCHEEVSDLVAGHDPGPRRCLRHVRPGRAERRKQRAKDRKREQGENHERSIRECRSDAQALPRGGAT